jgi:pimeloyl-ACP methyl ester carboxylesterase
LAIGEAQDLGLYTEVLRQSGCGSAEPPEQDVFPLAIQGCAAGGAVRDSGGLRESNIVLTQNILVHTIVQGIEGPGGPSGPEESPAAASRNNRQIGISTGTAPRADKLAPNKSMRGAYSRIASKGDKDMTSNTTTSNTSSERPVILINGVASNFESLWRRGGWVDKLEAAGRTVIGVDLPGHGTSKDAVGRDAADLILDEADKHGSVDAIGFSVGAWALLLAASEQPTLFERIAVLGAADMVLTAGLHHEDRRRRQ